MKINFFKDTDNQLLVNPRLSEAEKSVLIELKLAFEKQFSKKDFFLVPSSGSSQSVTDSVRLIALSKEAVLNSAQRFNQWLDQQLSIKNPKWGLVLPAFHVAGLSIYARAFLSNSEVVQMSWDVERFSDFLLQENVTHLSLVPTQIFDIIEKKLQCPPGVKLVLIGGAQLQPHLKNEFKGLGWPCYETYGMTETSSLIAYRDSANAFTFLPGVQYRVENFNLKIKCNSLLTAYVQKKAGRIEIWSDLDQEGYLKTSDKVQILDQNQFLFLGRDSEYIKINGEGVSLIELRQKLEDILLRQDLNNQAVLLSESHDRSGHQIVLVTLLENPVNLVEQFNSSVRPYEKIVKTYYVQEIPKTDLGKIKYKELEEKLFRR